jgi:hypothetical protein
MNSKISQSMFILIGLIFAKKEENLIKRDGSHDR